jgi:hypothetical protein
MFVMKRFSWNACPTTAAIPSATMIEWSAINIGIAAPVGVPKTINSGRQAELQLTLAEVIFGDLDEVPATVLMPVMLTAKPSVPFASQQQGPGRGGAPP